MINLNNRTIAYASLGGGGVALVLSLILGVNTSTAPLVGLASALFAVTLATHKYGYFLLPMLTKATNRTETRGNHEIPPAQDVVVKSADGVHYASVFLAAKIFESTTQDSGKNFAEAFEKALSSTKFVAKFCVLLYVKDLQEYRDRLDVARIQAEMKLSHLRQEKKPDAASIAREERRIASYNKQLERLAAGEKPMAALFYLMTTAAGLSKRQAIEKAKAQAKELKATVGNALNAEITELSSDDMKRCFEWEYALPATPEELEDEVFA